jgi:hypothetical protein
MDLDEKIPEREKPVSTMQAPLKHFPIRTPKFKKEIFRRLQK